MAYDHEIRSLMTGTREIYIQSAEVETRSPGLVDETLSSQGRRSILQEPEGHLSHDIALERDKPKILSQCTTGFFNDRQIRVQQWNHLRHDNILGDTELLQLRAEFVRPRKGNGGDDP